jgi:hypothetical protein
MTDACLYENRVRFVCMRAQVSGVMSFSPPPTDRDRKTGFHADIVSAIDLAHGSEGKCRDRKGRTRLLSAWCPELKGCQSQGDTLEDAVANIKEAIELYLETLR